MAISRPQKMPGGSELQAWRQIYLWEFFAVQMARDCLGVIPPSHTEQKEGA